MAALPFHPTVAEWFTENLGEPTPAQTSGWTAIREGRHTLVAAPTGSGKTLAAFLDAIDTLVREGAAAGSLDDVTRVVYVSPLKALSTDIHRNLELPLRGIQAAAERHGVTVPTITAAVRTGDTPASQRAAMVRRPPHILVTTPESLYLLLTAQRSREMLRTVRTVIVDEIHAILDSRRGAHQAVTLQRLDHVTTEPLQRIGLSATQKPIEEVAHYLVGGHASPPPDVAIVDEGHRRALDVALEVPDSPLETVMSHEAWQEVYARIETLVHEHRTTLIFVNTRRMTEWTAHKLTERLGEDAVTAHHGSLSKAKRLDAETRLKNGQLKALVATASLELGIDIGHVDLVIQLGSPRWISTFLQRVGRSGHTVRGTPKGRLFPLTRDDLVECTALIRAVHDGELDRLLMLDHPLDVLAQQIVAEAACEDWCEDDLAALFRAAYPYRHLTDEAFHRVVRMAAEGYTGRRGRRGAYIHYDGVNRRIRGRRNARLAAITAGGAIPDNADYRVILDPEDTYVGTVNEDFAVESAAGDIFQLGNTAWRILSVGPGTVRVADAAGQPPTIPFWLGEAPGRSAELSAAVSALRADAEAWFDRPGDADDADLVTHLATHYHIPAAAADQVVAYLRDARHILGVLPTQETLVLERFFDEAGGMQLVLHAPFGSRINRAWGLALRKKFCRQFNFELQAAATEEGLILSLGPQHSFPLEDVFRYLHPDTLRTTLVQALLDSPVFPTRWRWNATISLAVLRREAGRRVPPHLQRMRADDLMAASFPDAAACLENIGGDREIPDHPLVHQSIEDCVTEAMDLPGLTRIIQRIFDGAIRCVTRDTPEPSTLSHGILNSAPYSYLDDEGEIAERRARAVHTRRATEPSAANELGRLDADAIQRVADEAWPDPRDPDELHDTLMVTGFLSEVEGINARGESWQPLFETLAVDGRATLVTVTTGASRQRYWVATERRPEAEAVWNPAADTVTYAPDVVVPPEAGQRDWTFEEALTEWLRGRLSVLGPTTTSALVTSLGLGETDIELGMVRLEGEGVVLRGQFTGHTPEREWCDRRLLARIHRYTLNRLRAEIQPVSPADFMRFLFAWQHVDEEHRMRGPEGLAEVVAQLDGFELAAGAWEVDVLGTRVADYDPLMLDGLCLTGRVGWGRLSPPLRPGAGPHGSGPIRSTPVALARREHLATWLTLGGAPVDPPLSANAAAVYEVLVTQGASFFADLTQAARLLATHVEQALGELVALGLVTADSFAGLRALLIPSDRRKPLSGTSRRGRGKVTAPFGVESAGRWTGLRPRMVATDDPTPVTESDVEVQAWTLLRRYGVVFRKLLTRETTLAPWRDLIAVYRRLEARGEIRGGRFVTGMSGEQFALPEAVGQLRRIRRCEPTGQLHALSAADPLNLTGIVTTGDRVPALAANRVVYRDGVPVAAREARQTRWLVADPDAEPQREVEHALARRLVPPTLRSYLGRTA